MTWPGLYGIELTTAELTCLIKGIDLLIAVAEKTARLERIQKEVEAAILRDIKAKLLARKDKIPRLTLS